jgi:putative hydrolase of the HAD superfamily|tara:strand:- start:830 stop:1501 length:672 start_codon:yes stop_codon:yes gene_type:complete
MIELKNKKNLLLDLDGTVYQDLESVFGQVSKLMTKYISEKLNIDLKKAKELQTNYFYKYNTSLNGLMIHHDIPPLEFLNYVHNIDLSFMKKDLILREQLEKLDMRKLIFTNGSADHAKNILSHLGIEDLFEGIFDITDAKYQPKPEPNAFDLMVKKFGINPKDTIYVEDIAKNLSIGKERGCSTVWLINNEQWGKKDSDKDYIDHKIENLSLFLKEIRLLKSN